ncbi:MAG: PCI domain-containing protein [Candidatus Thermoplasmatota archaeon]|nr:PCI domain-containing protein [Candidatus Thermoplasmatota archaeon]
MFHKMLKVLGFIGILVFIFLFSIGVSYLVNPTFTGRAAEEGVRAGGTLSICSLFIFAPSIIFLFLAVSAERKHAQLKEYSAFLQARRRMKIADFARKIGKSEFEAESIIAKCIDKKILYGYIDRQTEEFFTPEGAGRGVAGWKCTGCGGNNDVLCLEGEMARCKYCGKSKTKTSQPRAYKIPPH